jgi:hypothetical protein
MLRVYDGKARMDPAFAVVHKTGRKVDRFQPEIIDHQQICWYEDGSWKGPGPPLLVAADDLAGYRGQRLG